MKTHGLSKTRLFKCYDSMKYRVKHDKNWTSKNIRVCDEWWNNPQAFFDWALSNGYRDDLTLDRIDTYGNYESSNCRWITKAEQQRNRTNNHLVTIGGETKTMAEWAEISGSTSARILYRIKSGYVEEELLLPKNSIRKSKKINERK